MSYQVLARKWRPRFFREMVGQEHVLQALINALDHNRLHHAYLFTGTRGVGKTTIARILAKCLNCETGVTSEPCGQCSSCEEINQGCFIDLIEVDAASRTKVEDTRELLDNVQYAPTKGRYKVYLIDEVHMLSTHSFNALLKTLEEPPEHVKFLLATTDPQKLPATILSRCLQFNLKNMQPERIVGHLQNILQKEGFDFDDPALWALARSADGSMRDALSLTDQAIAFGSGKVLEQQVREMLGSIDQQTVFLLAEALAEHDAAKLLAVIADFSEQAPDYIAVLDELLLLLHRMTVAQVVPATIDNSQGDQQRLLTLAQSVTAEELQLFYQMGILAKRDMALAPDLRSGLEMAVLRMLVFRPEGVVEPPSQVLQNNSAAVPVAALAETSVSPVEAQQSVDGDVINNALVEAADNEKKSEALTAAPAVEAVIEEKPLLNATAVIVSAQPPVAQASAVLTQPLESRAAVNTLSAVATAPVPQQVPVPAQATALAQVTAPVTLQDPAPAQITAPVTLQAPVPVQAAAPVTLQAPAPVQASAPAGDINTIKDNADWLAVFSSIPFNGLLRSVAAECVLISCENRRWFLSLDKQKAQLYNDRHGQQISETLSAYFATQIVINIEELQAGEQQTLQTPALYLQQLKQLAYDGALKELQEDVVLQGLLQKYSAEIVMNTVKALDVESGK